MGVGMLGCACCPGCDERHEAGVDIIRWDQLFEPDYPTDLTYPIGWCYNNFAGTYRDQTLIDPAFFPMTLHADADTITSDGTKETNDARSGCRSIGPLRTTDHTVFLEADNLTANDNKFGLFTEATSTGLVWVSDRTGVVVIYDYLQTVPGSTTTILTSYLKIRMEFIFTNVSITSTPAGGNWYADADVEVKIILDDVLVYNPSYTGKQIRKCGAAAAIFYKPFTTWTINDYRSGVE